jgi:hypothetical protein
MFVTQLPYGMEEFICHIKIVIQYKLLQLTERRIRDISINFAYQMSFRAWNVFIRIIKEVNVGSGVVPPVW